jgi:hypothetical protein
MGDPQVATAYRFLSKTKEEKEEYRFRRYVQYTTDHPTSTESPAAANATTARKGISCNRDAISSIRSFSSSLARNFMPSASSFGDDFSHDCIQMGRAMTMIKPQIIDHTRKVAYIAKGDPYVTACNNMMKSVDDMNIKDAYVEYSTKGEFKTVATLINSLRQRRCF